VGATLARGTRIRVPLCRDKDTDIEMNTEEFEYEYDLSGLQLITPRNRNFQMMVVPRYVAHYCKNVYEDFTSDLLLNQLDENAVFIDVGAHYGYYTLLAGTRQPNRRIIAFEPVPENFEVLKRNIALNQLKNVQLCNAAVSDSDGLRKFNVTKASDSCSFCEHPLSETRREIEVETVSLDRFLGKTPKVPVVVKVDAEGHEPYVLHGMKRLIRTSVDIKMIIEFNPKCLSKGGYKPEQFMEEIFRLGFDIYAVDDGRRLTYKLERKGVDKWANYLPEQDENRATNLLCVRKKDSLSVCLFTPSAQLDDRGRDLLELTRQLTDRNAICIVVLPGGGPLRDELDKSGVSTLVVDYRWWCTPGMPTDDEMKTGLANSFENILSALPDLNKINPDVILSNTLLIPWGALVGSLLGKPHIWSIHEVGELRFHLSLETVGTLVENFSNIILLMSQASSNLPPTICRSKKTLALEQDLPNEKTAELVMELLRDVRDKPNRSLDSLSKFAAQAVVASLTAKDGQIAQLNLSLRTRDALVRSLEKSLGTKTRQVQRLESQLDSLQAQTRRLESQMRQIQHSIPMQLADRYERIAARLLAPGTRRRGFYERALAGVKVILNEGWRSFFRRAWNKLT
jgi:FkbM family methyltransferase